MTVINPIDLVFKEQPAGPGAVNLVFGAETAPPAAELTIDGALPALSGTFYCGQVSLLQVDGTLPTLSGEFVVVQSALMQMDGALPALSGEFSALYISNASRPTVGKTQHMWQVADHGAAGTQAAHSNSVRKPVGVASPHQDADALQSIAPLSWQSASRSVRENRNTRFQTGQRVPAQPSRAPWQAANHAARLSRTSGFQAGVQVHPPGTVVRYRDGYRDRRNRTAVRWQGGVRTSLPYTASSAKAVQMPVGWRTDFQDAMRPPAGMWVPSPVVPAEPGCYTPPPGDNVPLLFSELFNTSTDLLFYCQKNGITPPTANTVVPIRRTYIVLNDVQLIRVDGNLELPALALSLNIDMDSWTWVFSASLPASALSLIEPGVSGDPVLLQAVINGASYLLLAESITRDRTFGKSSISVSGRGQSAMLADPYSPIQTFANAIDRTAQQLMNDALTTNGVSIGWAIDWRIDDWLVPSGAWSHQGSYMSAVNAIAAAAGAFVQPDPALKILRVRPRYPYKPWEWYGAGVIPDLELPTAAIVKESIAWTEKPAYNAVYVSGTTAGGILGHVKRAGTAGDMMAPMIADALITQAAAARQRGTNVLADTGRGATYSLSLPVLAETGIIDLGTLVRYVDNGNPTIGVVKGVSVNVTMPSLRQTIEVQTHG